MAIFSLLQAFSLNYVPASTNGALADMITGTKVLRNEGVILESSANIVELRMQLIKTIAGKRTSFLTLKGDTFFFTKERIWLERKGVILMAYFVETKKASIEVNPAVLTFGLHPKISLAKIPQTTQTSVSIERQETPVETIHTPSVVSALPSYDTVTGISFVEAVEQALAKQDTTKLVSNQGGKSPSPYEKFILQEMKRSMQEEKKNTHRLKKRDEKRKRKDKKMPSTEEIQEMTQRLDRFNAEKRSEAVLE